MRLLTTCEEYKDFGFYTYLGNYFREGYVKSLLDGSREDRFITQSICGFSNNIQKSFKDQLENNFGCNVESTNEKGIISSNDFNPFITHVTPQYIINNNNIGIKFLDDGTDAIATKGDKGVVNVQADYWLSIYELPNLIFYTMIKGGQKSKSVRDIIENCAKHIPVEKEVDKRQQLTRSLNLSIMWCDTKLNEIERVKENETAYGKKNFSTLKAGVVASILIKDFIWLQPSCDGGRDKITGANYQALQRSLAYYPTNRTQLNSQFRGANLVNSKNKHPFLEKIDPSKYSTLISFYKAYLEYRRIYFEGLKKKLLMGKTNIQSPPFHTPQQAKGRDGMPIMLPRGLFQDEINKAFKNLHLDKKTPGYCVGGREKNNSAWLIKKYFEYETKGATQHFYGADVKRTYRLFSKKKDLKTKFYANLDERKALLKEYKPQAIESNLILPKEEHLERKQYNEVTDNEAAIRFNELQDMIQFLMVKKMLPLAKDLSANFKLSDINGILNQSSSFTYILSGITIEAENIKIKDYGKILSLRSDSKFRSLSSRLKSFDGKGLRIKYSSIIAENDDYEDCRIEVLRVCLQFEKALIEANYDIEKEEDGYYNFTKILKSYQTKNNIESSIIDKCIEIRNMFLHSWYNEIDNFKPLQGDTIGYAKIAKEYFTEHINLFLIVIN